MHTKFTCLDFVLFKRSEFAAQIYTSVANQILYDGKAQTAATTMNQGSINKNV